VFQEEGIVLKTFEFSVCDKFSFLYVNIIERYIVMSTIHEPANQGWTEHDHRLNYSVLNKSIKGIKLLPLLEIVSSSATLFKCLNFLFV
jgi:hypothetical protein